MGEIKDNEKAWGSGTAADSVLEDAAWQPIETAPKDGEAVILTEGGKVFHGGFITIDFKEIRDSEGNFIDWIDPDEYWMNFDEGDVCTPTHWMSKRSLPMPPDAAKWGTPAPAVQEPVVQDDLITIRKPTTRAEMLWLLKLAHLVISDVDKTLEKTFAPAQELLESFTAADMRAYVDADRASSAQQKAGSDDLRPLPPTCALGHSN